MRAHEPPKHPNMPYTITKVETTPNPNARKISVEPSPGAIRSYFNPESASQDPLGSALFSIIGVTNVLIHTQFISICKEPKTPWKPLLTKIERVLNEAD